MHDIIVVAEKRILSKNTNMFSNELDFSSEAVTNGIIAALREKSLNPIHYDSPKLFLEHIKEHSEAVVFSNLWGGFHSRNKRLLLSAICEAYDLKYVGADAYVQAICQDKYLTKSYLKKFDFSIPKAIVISSIEELGTLDKIDFYPCVVKPNDEGCSVGISAKSLVYDNVSARNIALPLLKHYSPILVEEFIPGKEISICCAGKPNSIDILEAVELQINGNSLDNTIWGYETKKMGVGSVTRKIITEQIAPWIKSEAKKLFSSLGKVDCMRIDGRLHNNKFYIIELSPDCSLHKSCFMSTAFYNAGFTYADMLEYLINLQVQ